MSCTGFTASWCPECGTCTCGEKRYEFEPEYEWDCPLHGHASKHAPLEEAMSGTTLTPEEYGRLLADARARVAELERTVAALRPRRQVGWDLFEAIREGRCRALPVPVAWERYDSGTPVTVAAYRTPLPRRPDGEAPELLTVRLDYIASWSEPPVYGIYEPPVPKFSVASITVVDDEGAAP